MARAKRDTGRPKGWARRWAWRLAAALLLALALFAGLHFVYPDVERLAEHRPQTTAMMEHRRAQWAAKGRHTEPQWRWAPYERISPNLVQAVLIAEDDKFFRHHGFDWGQVRRAVLRNIDAGGVRFGASTITQQLAKNLWLSPERSLWRKLREAVLTLRLEAALDKRRILELYLNVVEWDAGVFGAEAAARHYFGVSAAGLSPWQAARLAAVLPNPRGWDPARPGPYVTGRARDILAEMRKRGYGNIWK